MRLLLLSLLPACLPTFPERTIEGDPLGDWDRDGVTLADGDCDDASPSVGPGFAEVCDEKDNDCDGETDEIGDDDGVYVVDAPSWYGDEDGDGYGIDSYVVTDCAQPEGFAGEGGDCDDGSPSIFPGANEVCGGADDDCDGLVDEVGEDGVIDEKTWYLDGDRDGWGTEETTYVGCEQLEGYAYVSPRPSPLARPRAALLVDHRRARRVDRGQVADLVDRMVVDHAEHRVQVLPRVQPVQTAASDQREQRGRGLRAALGPCEQPVLAADDGSTELELAPVVVDRDLGVAGADLEERPLVQRVGEGLADGAGRSLLVDMLDEPGVDAVERLSGVRSADAPSRLEVGVLQAALDVEEDADPGDGLAGEDRAALLGVDEVAAGV